MNKYDTQIILEEKSSLTYMISHIKEGSSVLEFGPATGYMTRYLSEEKKCKVSIIEIDEDAYRTASEYARDGICCDAEQMAWIDKFAGKKFDYITFADVLEHLREPKRILKACLPFLKKGGKVLASVPNIAHNAVLIDLYNNKFEYRKTGIMDNTHLRFYTHDSLHELFGQCGLYIEDEDAVVFDLEYVGFGNTEKDVPKDFWKEIYGRKYGFVNQFLFTLTKVEMERNVCFHDIRKLEMTLYYATKEDAGKYNEKHKICAELHREGGDFFAEFDISAISESMETLCFEPFLDYCVIEEIKAIADGGELSLNPMGGFVTEEGGIGFIAYSPKYEAVVAEESSINKIRLEGRVRTIQQEDVRTYILQEQEQANQEIRRLNQVIEEKLSIIHEMSDTIISNNQEIERLHRIITEKAGIIKEISEVIEKSTAIEKEL